MPKPVHTPRAAWEQWKPILEQRYVIEDQTCTAVQKFVYAQGFQVSSRQLKEKFKEWNWWKKLTCEHYGAMMSVTENVGLVDFLIPNGGGTRDRKPYKEVQKEWRRQKKLLEVPALDDAYESLRDRGITWVSAKVSTKMARKVSTRVSNLGPRAAGNGIQSLPNQQTRARRRPRQQVQRISDDEARDHSDSTASDMSMEDAPNLVADISRRLNVENFAPPTRFPQSVEDVLCGFTLNGPRSNTSIPYEPAWLADCHYNVFSHEHKLPEFPPRIVHHHESPCITSDYSNHYGTSLHGNSADRDMSGQKHIAEALAQYYRMHDQHGHKSAVLQFVAYYAGFLLAGQEIVDDYDDPHRKNARKNLTMMLDRCNMELLPACYWITIIAMSYDKVGILLAFFEDSIDSIETNSSYLATIMQPWVRFMVLIYRDLFYGYKPRSHRLEPKSLDSMNSGFDASSELQKSIDSLEQKGYLKTTTGLVLRLYRGWHLGQGYKADPHAALVELLSCLHESGTAFGPKHLVTIQCELLVARLYTEVNKPDHSLAETYLNSALLHLTPCSRMLEPVFHRALLERARHVLKQSRLDEARHDMEVVFRFHSRVMGARSPLTGEAAEELFAVMRRQGYCLEAQQREDDLNFQRAHQWKKHPGDN